MVWKSATSSRASATVGPPSSIAAMATVAAFVRLSRPMVISRAIVRAEGTRARLLASVLSARRRKVLQNEAYPGTSYRMPWRIRSANCTSDTRLHLSVATKNRSDFRRFNRFEEEVPLTEIGSPFLQ